MKGIGVRLSIEFCATRWLSNWTFCKNRIMSYHGTRLIQIVLLVVAGVCAAFGQANFEYYDTQTVYEPVTQEQRPLQKDFSPIFIP